MERLKAKLTGQRIKEMRKEKGLSQAELGERIGVSGAFISEVERGNKDASMPTLKAIAQAFDTTVGYLLGEVQVIKSDVTEVRVFDLVSGQLVAEGVQLMPSVLTTGKTILVRTGENMYFIDEGSEPASGQRALLEIGGRVTIQRVILQGERIQVGNTVFDRENVTILGIVTGMYSPEHEEF